MKLVTFIEAVLQNCHLTNEKPRMIEYVMNLKNSYKNLSTDLVGMFIR